MLKIERIELHRFELQLVHPFTTSYGSQCRRPSIVVRVVSSGLTGWGECVALPTPFYTPETVDTAWSVLHDFLVPMVIGRSLQQPVEAARLMAQVRGHQMAKAALENAIWDLFAKAAGKPLHAYLGGVRERVPVGVSIGLQPTVEELLERVAQFVEAGYRRIKIKIRKGLDYELLAPVREQFPAMMLMADANSDYELGDVQRLQRLDALQLLMIEQPLSWYDFIDHAKLQSQLATPVCLDESIQRLDDARQALELGACRMINLKVGRVGGLSQALAIHDLCRVAGIPLWCGGMLETGIGRATNLAVATLPNVTLPGDISATSRYYAEDITRPFVLNREDSTMTVPDGPGIGVEIDEERLAACRRDLFISEC